MKTRAILSTLILSFLMIGVANAGWATKHDCNKSHSKTNVIVGGKLELASKPMKNISSKRTGGFDVVTKRVTLTCYWASGRGTDYYSKRRMSSTGVRLVDGKHVSVDKRIFPYGTKIVFPDGSSCIAVDTGRDVISKKASRKLGVNYPVVDRFFVSKSDAIKYDNSQPKFIDIVAYIPRS